MDFVDVDVASDVDSMLNIVDAADPDPFQPLGTLGSPPTHHEVPRSGVPLPRPGKRRISAESRRPQETPPRCRIHAKRHVGDASSGGGGRWA
jgi:hypothetical protein